ncbi:MAG: carbon monoxide dehydrogenase accessory protein CooC [Anaerolineae bacterium]|nr:carbon monoxide dehydrogenase accessory protein CooC [Anaerolineae bacterium]
MKIAIAGKGGVGKTTLSAVLAHIYADDGNRVLAVDSDPAPCLAEALGFPPELRQQLLPVSQMDALIEERTGAKPGTPGGFFTLNPKVDDIPDQFSVAHNGVRLLEMGTVQTGGAGCMCPESAMLKTLLTHLLYRKDEILIVDMYAGLEHLGRATVDFVDVLLIVAEPTRRSLGTASQIKQLANDIGLHRHYLVGNKIREDQEVDFMREVRADIPLIGFLPYDEGVLTADHRQAPVYAESPRLLEAGRRITGKLENIIQPEKEGISK